jgi:hypothetical protein
LRPGGTLALWWSFGGLEGDGEADERKQAIYEKWRVGQRELITPAPDTSDPAEDLPARGFADVEAHQIVHTRKVTVDTHIGHISTHSPVLALREDLDNFQADLRDVFAGKDTVTEQVHCRMFLARRS